MKSEFRDLSLAWEKDEADDTATSGEEFVYNAETQFKYSDDSFIDPQLERQLAHLMDTITRVGGEVCRLRAEVDGLLEQNQSLRTSFDRLRDVISERGQLNMDDFELACDVVQASMNDVSALQKKIAN
jgi:regulator of replication initiation timing